MVFRLRDQVDASLAPHARGTISGERWALLAGEKRELQPRDGGVGDAMVKKGGRL